MNIYYLNGQTNGVFLQKEGENDRGKKKKIIHTYIYLEFF